MSTSPKQARNMLSAEKQPVTLGGGDFPIRIGHVIRFDSGALRFFTTVQGVGPYVFDFRDEEHFLLWLTKKVERQTIIKAGEVFRAPTEAVQP